MQTRYRYETSFSLWSDIFHETPDRRQDVIEGKARAEFGSEHELLITTGTHPDLGKLECIEYIDGEYSVRFQLTTEHPLSGSKRLCEPC
jgi:hypothetical protein